MIKWTVLLWLLAGSAIAQDVKENALHIRHTPDFTITGDSATSSWRDADWIDLAPRKGPAKFRTKAKMMYSDSGMYVLFICEDRKITATLKEDFADLYREDVVEIFFWPDERDPLYFEYELSPLNFELPILVPNYEGKFFGWKPWHYEGARRTRHRTRIWEAGDGSVSGWTAEFFIPFALLRPLQNVPPKKGSQWRANLYRIDYDTGYSNWSWQPVVKNFHDYERFGAIKFD